MDVVDDLERRIRSFVAIEVEEPVRAALVAYLAGLRATLDGVAWTRPENLHITLKFLGGVAPPQLRALADALEALAAVHPVFAVTFGGVGAFPDATHPRALWAGVHAPELGPLAQAVDARSAVAGVAPEARPYHPHVTLGRVRDRSRCARIEPGRTPDTSGRGTDASGRTPDAAAVRRATLAADRTRDFGTGAARALVLFRSDSGAGGVRYTPLARFAFATDADRYE